jgi:short-subunit dehydrogenase
MKGGQVVVVTGGSSGIGLEVGRAFARRGGIVVLAARRLERLHAVADEIVSAGGRALAIGCDVRRPGDAARLVEEACARFGRVDVLVNAAGYGVLTHAAETSIETYADVLQTNLLGAIHCVKAVLPGMLARRRGTIVNVASLAAVFAIPGFSAYAASKAGLVAFSEALRHDLRPFGIHVAVVCPAAVDTPFFAHPSFRGMPRLMRLGMRSPTAVSAAVLRAVDRRRSMVTIPRLFGLVAVVKAMLPGPLRAVVGALLGPGRRMPRLPEQAVRPTGADPNRL